MMKRASLAALLCLASTAAADAWSTTPAETWSMSAATRIGPFEDAPRLGFVVDALARVQPRMQIGPQLTYSLPRSFGSVRRSSLRIDAKLHSPMLEKGRVSWFIEGTVGVGRFHDDFERMFEDVTRTIPGVSIATGLAVRITERVRPFVAINGVAYFSDKLNDGQWVEVALGVRVPF